MPTSALAKKLQIKPGTTVALVNAPAGIEAKLRPLPERASISSAATARDAVIAFAKDQAELTRVAPRAIRAAKPGGLIWLCYPKAGAKTKTDLGRDVLWQIVEERHELEGVTLVAVDETWSAMRFRPPGAGRSKR